MSGSGVTVAQGGLDLRSGGNKFLLDSRRLDNAGSGMLREGGVLYLAGVFNNRAGATFDLTDDGGLFLYTGTPMVTNAGTLRRTTSAGTASITVPLSNTGTVTVQSGTLRLQGDSTSTGSFTTSAAGTLEFSSGTHSLSTLSLTGNVLVDGGAVNVAGAYSASTTTLNGGTLSVAASTATSGTRSEEHRSE